MKKVNICLAAAVIIPLTVLFWPMPYKPWNDTVDWLLCVIPSLAAQSLFCIAAKRSAVKAIPAVLTGAFALWGIYLNCAAWDWQWSRLGGLLRVFVSPFLCCALILAAFLCAKRKKRSEEGRTTP